MHHENGDLNEFLVLISKFILILIIFKFLVM